MAGIVDIPGVVKAESVLLGLFIPSSDRDMKPIDQAGWEQAALELLGTCFGGATAFPKGRGVWRDDSQGGKLIFDETIMLHCYTSVEAIEKNLTELHAFLVKKGQETNQGAVGFVLDGTYMEIRFPPRQGEAAHE
jgi:hypothetical protein